MAKKVRAPLQLRVFLSHGYKAPAANLYFWSVLSTVADVQFEVDVGTKATSVTRLERLMRDCDAIVGIFSFPENETLPDTEAARVARLHEASAYFRLETDLAIRSRKPTLLYIDQRYRRFFRVPRGFHVEWFNAQEIISPRVSPSRARFEKASRTFCKEVAVYKDYELTRKAEVDPHNVAVIVSGQEQNSPYSSATIDDLCEALSRSGIEQPTVIRYPSRGRSFQVADLDALNWCFTDVGPGLFRTGLVGYLHGRFVPMLRALYTGGQVPESIAEYRSLHVGIEKGYDSDLIKWDTRETLLQELAKRLAAINLDRALIANSADAERYFRKAQLRREAVFFSYAGEDLTVAAALSKALQRRFQDVFDYKFDGAIPAGEPWIEVIDKELKRASVGVQLISKSYFESRHCRQEAQIMNMLLNQRRMVALIPVKFQEGEIEGAPLFQENIQYLRLYRYETMEAAIEEIVTKVAQVEKAA